MKRPLKRPLAVLSVLAVLVLSGEAAAPAFAGTILYEKYGATLECEPVTTPVAGAKYTLKFKLLGKNHEYSSTFAGATCSI